MIADTINQTFLTYQRIRASLNITEQIAESSDPTIKALYKSIPFWEKSATDFDSQMVSTTTEFKDIMVLALFAAFERELRISVQNVLSANLHPQNSMISRLVEK
jgi:hypothetical protein